MNEDSAVATNGTQGPLEYSHHWKYLKGHPSMRNIALKLISVFYLLIEKPLGCYFQVLSPYYRAAICNQKTPICVSLR